MREAKLFVGGEWLSGAGRVEVLDKFTLAPTGFAHAADKALVDRAVAAGRAAFLGGALSIPERHDILMRAQAILLRRKDEIVETMVAETGFTRADNEGDFARTALTLNISAEEAMRITGEMVPIEASPGHETELAFSLRVPLGVVACITPFNSPLNTVAHKIAPALAAGNAVVLKPASYTPFSAALLVEVFEEAGLPAGWLNLVHGPGGATGAALCANPDVAYFAFTGGGTAGAAIQAAAGMRRTQMELGNISATIVCEDADLDQVAVKAATGAFKKAGQVCTSLQRLYVHEDVFDALSDRLVARARAMRTGDPRDPATQVGPMISEGDAMRVERLIGAAREAGARVLTGGGRQRALLEPTVLDRVEPGMGVHDQELFAPVVCLLPYNDFDAAIDAVNATPYGLAAGIFTRDMIRAFHAARKVEVGVFNINNTSSNRVDPMPYGGIKASGWGKEGPRAAIRDMTDEKLITIRT